MHTLELSRLLQHTLHPYQQKAQAKGIGFNIYKDLVCCPVITAESAKLNRLLQTVMEGLFYCIPVEQIIFTTRQLLQKDEHVLLEFTIEYKGRIETDKRIAYYRSLVISRRLVEELRGKSEWDVKGPHDASIKFMIRCSAPKHTPQESMPCARLLHNKTLLVVDDNEMNRENIRQLLSKESIHLEMASNGKEAVEWLEKNTAPDVILMDLQMPRMDGIATTEYIRRQLQMKTPIIGMSAGADLEFENQCFVAGMNQFIQKPFQYELLMQQLCSFFEVESLRATG